MKLNEIHMRSTCHSILWVADRHNAYSFRTVGVNLGDVHIVCAIHGEIDPYFDKLNA
jgi:hypothetical protein